MDISQVITLGQSGSRKRDLTFVPGIQSGMHDVVLKPQRSGTGSRTLRSRRLERCEIVRVLRERMEPRRHLDELSTEDDV
jgi:plasmid stabilization system protein ParE